MCPLKTCSGPQSLWQPRSECTHLDSTCIHRSLVRGKTLWPPSQTNFVVSWHLTWTPGWCPWMPHDQEQLTGQQMLRPAWDQPKVGPVIAWTVFSMAATHRIHDWHLRIQRAEVIYPLCMQGVCVGAGVTHRSNKLGLLPLLSIYTRSFPIKSCGCGWPASCVLWLSAHTTRPLYSIILT